MQPHAFIEGFKIFNWFFHLQHWHILGHGKLLASISIFPKPIGSMYAIYGNIYHQYTPNFSTYSIHYGKEIWKMGWLIWKTRFLVTWWLCVGGFTTSPNGTLGRGWNSCAKIYPLVMTNIAMGFRWPIDGNYDVLPIKHGDVPWRTVK